MCTVKLCRRFLEEKKKKKDKRQRGEKKQEEWVRIITITLCPPSKKKVVGERTVESAMDDSGILECQLVYLKYFILSSVSKAIA